MTAHKFTVGGKQISLSAKEVEDLLTDVPTPPVHKHFVVVGGRRFPVKHALSLVANLPSSSFITTEAARVFKTLGFEVGKVGEARAEKNESETLFEQYLAAQGLGHFQYEPTMDGTSRRPDYLIRYRGETILFDVKQFEATPEDFRATFGFYDPYGPIREKIEAGRKKFRDLERFPCCLVLFNRGKPLVDLSWTFVYGAMLGNVGIRMQFDPNRGRLLPETAQQGFVGGSGKMHRYAGSNPIEAQNQTVSAVLVLDRLRLGQRRFLAHLHRREREQDCKLGIEESMTMLEEAKGTERDWGLLQTRLMVYENPYARIPLTRDLFNGPFNERYGEVDGNVSRIFAGQEIIQLELEEEG